MQSTMPMVFYVCFCLVIFFIIWLVRSRIFEKILTVSISVSKAYEGYQEIALYFDRNIFIWYGHQSNSSEGLRISSASFSFSSGSFLRNVKGV